MRLKAEDETLMSLYDYKQHLAAPDGVSPRYRPTVRGRLQRNGKGVDASAILIYRAPLPTASMHAHGALDVRHMRRRRPPSLKPGARHAATASQRNHAVNTRPKAYNRYSGRDYRL